MDSIKFSLIVVGPLDSQRKVNTGLLRIIKVKAMVVASFHCIPIYMYRYMHMSLLCMSVLKKIIHF